MNGSSRLLGAAVAVAAAAAAAAVAVVVEAGQYRLVGVSSLQERVSRCSHQACSHMVTRIAASEHHLGPSPPEYLQDPSASICRVVFCPRRNWNDLHYWVQSA